MMRLARRPVLILGLLLAAATSVGSAPAAPPRGMGGMRGGMTPPPPMRPMTMGAGMSMFRTPQGMGSPLLPMAPGMGMYGFPAYSMPGRSGYGSGDMGSGGGYSGGGSGSSSAASMASPGLSGAYANPCGSLAPAPSQAPNPKAGPLLGLLNAEGGLDWPLALRILPPETRDLRQQIDARAGEVQRQAAGGAVDAGLLRDTRRDVDRLRELLADREDRLPVSEQAKTDGRRFIRKLRGALATDPLSTSPLQ